MPRGRNSRARLRVIEPKRQLCWAKLWTLVPEKVDLEIAVPAWPQFLRGCVHYRDAVSGGTVRLFQNPVLLFRAELAPPCLSGTSGSGELTAKGTTIVVTHDDSPGHPAL